MTQTVGQRLGRSAVALVLCLAPVLAAGASLTAQQSRALHAAPEIELIDRLVQARSWDAVYEQVARFPTASAPADAAQELAAYRLARGLVEAPMRESGRRWLNSVAQWSVLATETLPDAGRGVQVPAFPAAHAARATLRTWAARESVRKLGDAVRAGVWPDNVMLTAETLARLDDATLDALLVLRPGDVPVPAAWALRWAALAPSVERVGLWLEMESRSDAMPSAHRRVRAFTKLLATGDGAVFAQLAAAADARAELAPAWLAALADVPGYASLRELQRWVAHPHLGLDALHALSRSVAGRTWIRRQVTADAQTTSDRLLRCMLIVLAQRDEQAFLRTWARERPSSDPLSMEVLAWLGD